MAKDSFPIPVMGYPGAGWALTDLSAKLRPKKLTAHLTSPTSRGRSTFCEAYSFYNSRLFLEIEYNYDEKISHMAF